MLLDLMWALYFIDVLSSLLGSIAFALFIVSTPLVVYTCVTLESFPTLRTMVKVAFLGVFLGLLMSAVPSKDTMYLMLGVKTTDSAMKTDTGQRLQMLLDKKLEKYLGEFEETKTENVK